MDSKDLEKLDVIPTSNKPWHTSTPFNGVILFVVMILIKIIYNWLFDK